LPYVVKTIVPQVEGVVVVGEGCGTGSVDKNVTEIVQALFGLEAHKVKVVKMSD
jgi:stage III sporulation protein AG